MNASSVRIAPLSARWYGAPLGLWVFDLIFVSVFATFVFLSPCGAWVNAVWGWPFWNNSDPGGPYVISSLFFFRQFGHPPFIGHPGVLLQAMIAVGAHGIYTLCSLFGHPEPFVDFWAKNIRWAFILAGLIIVMMHVVSFHVVYAFAKHVIGDSKAAFLAVLGYATLFPVLFYATRISVEPMLVSTVLLTFLLVWQVRDAWGDDRRRRAYFLAGLAGATSAAAMLTKLHLAFPLIPLAALQLFLQNWGKESRSMSRVATRYKLELCFLVVAIGVLGLGALSMDVPQFFGIWNEYSPVGNRGVSGRSIVADGSGASQEPNESDGMVAAQWNGFKDRVVGYFTPGSYLYPFTIAEAVFVAISGLGLVVFWKAQREKRGMLAWPLLYGVLLLPVVAYRGCWHYLFVHLVVASVFFGFALHAAGHWLLARRFSPAVVNGLLILVVFVVHSLSIAFALESKCTDARIYRSTYQAFHEALALIRPGQRVAVLTTKGMSVWGVHGSFKAWSSTAQSFHRGFEDRFVVVRKRELTRKLIAARRVGAVVDVRQEPWRVELIKGQVKRAGKSKAQPGPIVPSTRNAE